MALAEAVNGDLEAQPVEEFLTPSSTAPEYAIPMSKKLAHLALYFTCNISLTLYNKMVLGRARRSLPRRLLTMSLT